MTNSVRKFGFITIIGFLLSGKLNCDEYFHIPRARYLFSPAAAPSGETIVVNISEEGAPGEVTRGFAALLRMDVKSPFVKRLSTSKSQDTNTQARWTSDGSKLFFVTENGIFIRSSSESEARILKKGSFAGLAISSDDSKLAFWNLAPSDEHNYELVVLDLRTNEPVRSWSIPTRFDSDQYGFEISFSPDDRSLFARTYDTEGGTPLKKFDLVSGETKVISDNCLGLAPAKQTVYFVAQSESSTALWKIVNGSDRPLEVATTFPYDDIVSSGTLRWIVARRFRQRKLALIDSLSDKLVVVDGQCDSVVVMANGVNVYFRNGKVSTTPGLCSVGVLAKE